MVPRLIVRADRLWDGDRLWRHAAVVVEGESIAAVEMGRVELSPGPSPDMEVIDLADVTLIPGLVDAHQHLCFDPFGDRIARIEHDDDETLFDCVRRAGATALRAGITTVRDLGDRGYLALRLRELSGAEPQLGPTVVASGPPITPTRGHCWFLGGEADGPLEVRAAVAERAANGVDVVKIMATGGLMTPGSGLHKPQYEAATLAVATRTAHAHGLPITAHAHGPQGIADAVEAGVDGIEHATFLTEDGIDFDPAT
ncbi:MAG: amidohydrolase family protein, partial [Acidimicrobiia bacterium]